MPVILTGRGESDVRMRADPPKACALQRPLPDGALRIEARGERKDGEAGSGL